MRLAFQNLKIMKSCILQLPSVLNSHHRIHGCHPLNGTLRNCGDQTDFQIYSLVLELISAHQSLTLLASRGRDQQTFDLLPWMEGMEGRMGIQMSGKHGERTSLGNVLTRLIVTSIFTNKWCLKVKYISTSSGSATTRNNKVLPEAFSEIIEFLKQNLGSIGYVQLICSLLVHTQKIWSGSIPNGGLFARFWMEKYNSISP